MAEDAEQISLVWDLVVALWGRLGDPEDEKDNESMATGLYYFIFCVALALLLMLQYSLTCS